MSDKVLFPNKEGVSSSLDTATGLVELSKWNKEAWTRFGSSLTLVSSEKIGDKYKLTYGEYDVQVSESPNGLEYEIVLGKVPSSNVFTIPITSQNLNFYYQPALTQAEIDAGCVRPENVVGSYAVYHSSKTGNEYRAGKAFHIYRPKVIADDGAWTWGVLDYKDGVLSVTVDRAWLDKAKYPVMIDPTFGYEGEGASTHPLYTYGGIANWVGVLFTSPASGTVNNIKVYGHGYDIGYSFLKGTLVTHNDLTIVSDGVGQEIALDGPSLAWVTSTFSTPPTLTALTDYVLSNVSKNTVSVPLYSYNSFAYDSGDADQGHYETDNNYNSPTNPSAITHNNNKYSIYCNYTPGAPAAGGLKMIPSLRGHMGYDLKTRAGKARRRIF